MISSPRIERLNHRATAPGEHVRKCRWARGHRSPPPIGSSTSSTGIAVDRGYPAALRCGDGHQLLEERIQPPPKTFRAGPPGPARYEYGDYNGFSSLQQRFAQAHSNIGVKLQRPVWGLRWQAGVRGGSVGAWLIASGECRCNKESSSDDCLFATHHSPPASWFFRGRLALRVYRAGIALWTPDLLVLERCCKHFGHATDRVAGEFGSACPAHAELY